MPVYHTCSSLPLLMLFLPFSLAPWAPIPLSNPPSMLTLWHILCRTWAPFTSVRLDLLLSGLIESTGMSPTTWVGHLASTPVNSVIGASYKPHSACLLSKWRHEHLPSQVGTRMKWDCILEVNTEWQVTVSAMEIAVVMEIVGIADCVPPHPVPPPWRSQCRSWVCCGLPPQVAVHLLSLTIGASPAPMRQPRVPGNWCPGWEWE